jgi:CheY-like chemotaxis protein
MIKKALVVDDFEISRLTISTFLTVSGFSVDTAGNGMEGLKCLEANKYDLIFSDIEMPTMNGFEFLKRVKRNPFYKNIPVVVLTTSSDAETINKAKELGASCHITKPYNRVKMLSALESAGF